MIWYREKQEILTFTQSATLFCFSLKNDFTNQWIDRWFSTSRVLSKVLNNAMQHCLLAYNHHNFQNVHAVGFSTHQLLHFLFDHNWSWLAPPLKKKNQRLQSVQLGRFSVFKLMRPSGVPPSLTADLCIWSKAAVSDTWLLIKGSAVSSINTFY